MKIVFGKNFLEFKTEGSLPASLYFPLCNTKGLKSYITPYLRGDIKLDQDIFLLQPQTRWDIQTSLISRKVFVILKKKILTLHNLPPFLEKEKLYVEAGPLYHKIIKEFPLQKIIIEATNFVPLEFNTEVMIVRIKNASASSIKINLLLGFPLYCRSAHNIRDHHHVTSLLNRTYIKKYGIINKPTLIFDERGHHPNIHTYFCFSFDEKAYPPQYLYSDIEGFTQGGNLDFPLSLFYPPPKNKKYIEGKEVVAGFKYVNVNIPSQKYKDFFVILGICTKNAEYQKILKKFSDTKNIYISLEKAKNFWMNKINQIYFYTEDNLYNNWVGWVRLQPLLRKIYGNSFLADFDYGKGGRGWRDLWQDCLHLLFVEPNSTRKLLIHNFQGIRVDGSNATIINYDNSFRSDRNNIPRVWSDHGAWPFFVIKNYIDFTGDYNILFKETTYWQDHLLKRCTLTQENFPPDYKLRTSENKIYKGTILEHILIENLIQFFNVGKHLLTRLENADWNDALDLAPLNGETVPFSCFYAYNLQQLSILLERIKPYVSKSVYIFEELFTLLDTLWNKPSYHKFSYRRKIFEKYMQKILHFKGKKIRVDIEDIIKDLRTKALSWIEHIRNNEWINIDKERGFFNGYYDEEEKRVEGVFRKKVKISLTSQVFSILSGVATSFQIKKILKSTEKYLWDKRLKSLHLNNNYKELNLKLGRMFGFSYGDKENGAIFSHMNVMFAYALYERDFAKEGYKILDFLYKLSTSTSISKIYPCLPEYFNLEGKGLYSYLTGSASWYVFTLLTQVMGIKGNLGDLIIQPKFTGKFSSSSIVECRCNFRDKRLHIYFYNPYKKEYPFYKIKKVMYNGKDFSLYIVNNKVHIPYKIIKKLDSVHKIEINLS